MTSCEEFVTGPVSECQAGPVGSMRRKIFLIVSPGIFMVVINKVIHYEKFGSDTVAGRL